MSFYLFRFEIFTVIDIKENLIGAIKANVKLIVQMLKKVFQI